MAEETFDLLVRSSLKRTYDVFKGNNGLMPQTLPDVKNAKKKLKGRLEFSPPEIQKPVVEKTNLLAIGGDIPAVSASSSNVLAVKGGSTSKSLLPAAKNNQGSVELNIVPRKQIVRPKPQKHYPWKLKRVISGSQGWVRCLAVDASNEWFASGGNDRLIKIWDMATGSLKLTLTGHINTVRGLEVSDRHPYLFSCGEDQQVKCWDLEYNKAVRSYHGHLSGVYSLCLHPDLDLLASAGRDAVVRLWDIRTKAGIHVFSGHGGTIMRVKAQRGEPQLISGGNDKMIRGWDLVAGKCSWVLTHHKKSIRDLALHPKEYSFASGASDHVKVWRCPQGTFDRNIDGAHGILNTVCIKDDGTRGSVLVGGTDSGSLHFWDWKSGVKFQSLESIPQSGSLAAENGIFATVFDRSESRLITGECDKTIKIWEEDESVLLGDD